MKLEELLQNGSSAYFVVLLYMGRAFEKMVIVHSVGTLSKKCAKMTMYAGVPEQYMMESIIANGAESLCAHVGRTMYSPSHASLDICNRSMGGMLEKSKN